MKVLYFHQHFTTTSGASGTRSYEFAKRLISRGHKVTLICGSLDIGKTGLQGKFKGGVRRGDVDGIDIIELSLPYGNEMGYLMRFLVFLRFMIAGVWLALREPCDLIFCTSTPLSAGIPGLVCRIIRGKPFVFEVRDLWPEIPEAMQIIRNPLILQLMGMLARSIYKRADRVIALAPGIKEEIEKKNIASDKIIMIPNGSDLKLFDKVRKNDENRFQIVFCGAHGLANGLDKVLDAALQLKLRRDDMARFVFVGEGGEKKRLISRAAEMGLNNCEFLDSMPKTELAYFLAKCDAAIMCLENISIFHEGSSPNKFFREYVCLISHLSY